MAGAATTSWSGGLELAGFPINVKLYATVASASADSFRMLAPESGVPVKQQLIDPSTGEVVERSDTLKGVEVSKDKYVALDKAAVDAIALRERTQIAAPRSFCPLGTVPLGLATKRFAVRPNDKVPGAEVPVGILWNGLLASGLAYVTELTMRSGSRDTILILHADEEGLWASSLPYITEVKPLPEFRFERDEKAANLFAQFVQTSYATEDFDHHAFESQYTARREAAIAAALKGEPVEVAQEATPAKDAPDLMALMEAQVAAKGPTGKKPKARKPAKKAAVKS